MKESEGENTLDLIIKLLASALDTSAEVETVIDTAYRVNSSFAKRFNKPKEIHVTFIKKRAKEEVFKVTRENPLKCQDEEVKILRDLPWEVRSKRREYRFLTEILHSNEIQYRWLTPEGLLFTFKGNRQNINTIYKAKAFVRKHFPDLETQSEEERGTSSSKSERDEKEEEQGATGGVKTRRQHRKQQQKQNE